MSKTVQLTLILGVLLLNAAIFIIGLNKLSLFVDEGWTTAVIFSDDLGTVTDWLEDDVHPPLYFYMMYFWEKVAGDTIFALRYVAILQTLLTIAIIYKLTTTLFNPVAGIVASLFFALHDLIAVLGQEIRHYPQSYLLVTLTLWLYWRFYQKTTFKRGLWFVLSGAAVLWTHYWGGFVLLAIGCHALFTRKKLIPTTIASIIMGFLFLPWLPAIYTQVTEVRPDGLLHNLTNTWQDYKVLAYQIIGIPEIFWGVLIVAGIFGAFRFRLLRPTTASALPTLAFIVPIASSIVLNRYYPTLWYRSLVIVIPAMAILIGYAVSQFRLREQLFVIGFIILHSVSTTSATPPFRYPWVSVADYLVEHTNEDDIVLIDAWFETYAFLYYFEHGNPESDYLKVGIERVAQPDEEYLARFLETNLEGYEGAWLILRHDDPFFRDLLMSQGWEFIETIYWDPQPPWQIQLWHYERPLVDTTNAYQSSKGSAGSVLSFSPSGNSGNPILGGCCEGN